MKFRPMYSTFSKFVCECDMLPEKSLGNIRNQVAPPVLIKQDRMPD